MDHHSLVYKVDDSVQSSLLSSLVLTLFELNSVPGVQYKDVMVIDDEKYQQE